MSDNSILQLNSHHEGQAFFFFLNLDFLIIVIFRGHDGEKHHEGMKEDSSLFTGWLCLPLPGALVPSTVT